MALARSGLISGEPELSSVPAQASTVRGRACEVLGELGMTTVFGNPGSTEIPFLAGWPSDFQFVMGLHEGAVVAMACGWALAQDAPAPVLLHTAAGLGNAVAALATARVNRVPLVVLVGQQDRRHLALEPFLAGRLAGMAGQYPVWWSEPARAQDVPASIARAWHEAEGGRGPAVVVIPMGDWDEAPEPASETAAPAQVRRPGVADPASVDAVLGHLEGASRPVLVAGAGAASESGWRGLVALAEKLGCPVWQEPFGARAGFPQDHPLFAGHLPAGRGGLRQILGEHDLALVVGAAAFRQYPFEEGPLLPAGLDLVVITDDPAEAYRSPARLAVIGPVGAACQMLADGLPQAGAGTAPSRLQPRGPAAPGGSGELGPADVFQALAQRLPAEAVVLEETPSSRPLMQELMPARNPLGFVSAAMGGLGFALPAAVGIKLRRPELPVVALLGDGSAIFGVHGLWSAAHYHAGALFVVLRNGRYQVMDQLARQRVSAPPPWPDFVEANLAALARGFGCAAEVVSTRSQLDSALDATVPRLGASREPLLLEVTVSPAGDPAR